MKKVAILSGSNSKRLAKEIYKNINEIKSLVHNGGGEYAVTKTFFDYKDVEVSYSEVKIENFSDGERSVQLEESFRGKTVFYIQTTKGDSVLIETMLTLDALRRNGVEKVYLVCPYYSYCRQDKMDGPRGAVGAKVLADVYQNLGADGIVTIDIHSAAIQGFFNEAFININGVSVFRPLLSELHKKSNNWIICSPDQGGTVRASKFAEQMEVSMVTIIKKRLRANEVHSMQLIGDVTGKDVLIIDDIADTCGTIKKATEYLLQSGANSVHAMITHPVLSGKAFQNLQQSGLRSLYVTDTIDITEVQGSTWVKNGEQNVLQFSDFKIEVISSADILSRTILNLSNNMSVHNLNS